MIRKSKYKHFKINSMKTENTIRNMVSSYNKTVFIEYSSAKAGQHFMTVMQTVDGKRRIIGRIYRVYDKENKRTTYTAIDWSGTPIFQDYNDLPTLKKQFIKYGKNLTLILPEDPSKAFKKDEEFERETEVREIRKKNVDREQERGIER
jgi:hypothetical protein